MLINTARVNKQCALFINEHYLFNPAVFINHRTTEEKNGNLAYTRITLVRVISRMGTCHNHKIISIFLLRMVISVKTK